MPDFLFIVNPVADRRRAWRRWQAVEARLRREPLTFDVVFTEGVGHALALSQKAAQEGRYGAIVAAGGDGTVNEVVNGLCLAAGDGVTVPLGVLPIGSANDLAHVLGIPRQPEGMVAPLLERKERTVDVGLVESADVLGPTAPRRFFINNSGLGFEAQVNLESRRVQRLRGFLIYLVAVFRALARYQQPFVRACWDGQERAERMLLVTIGNGRRAGGGFWLTPFAEVDDGFLDVGFAQALPRWRILHLLPKALNGRHVEDPAFTLVRCRHLHLRTDIPVPMHTDGEAVIEGTQEVRVQVLPKKVRLLADPARPLAQVRASPA